MKHPDDELDPRVDEALESLASSDVPEPDLDAALRGIRARLESDVAPTSRRSPWSFVGAALAAAAVVLVWLAVDSDDAEVGEEPRTEVAEGWSDTPVPVDAGPDVALELSRVFGALSDDAGADELDAAVRAFDLEVATLGRMSVLADVRTLLQDPDVGLARAALRYLVARGDRAHVPAIAAASRRPELCEQALAGLTELGATGWRELERALDDERTSRAVVVLRASDDDRALWILHDALSRLDGRLEPERVEPLVHAVLAKGSEGAERLAQPRLLRADLRPPIEDALASVREPVAVQALTELALERELGPYALRGLSGIATPESFAALLELHRRGRGPGAALDQAIGRATQHGREAWLELARELEGDPNRAAELLDMLLGSPGPATDLALAALLAVERVPLDARLLAVDLLRDLERDAALAEAFAALGRLAPSDRRLAAALVDATAARFGLEPVLDALGATGSERERLAALLADRSISHASRIVRIARELGGVPDVSPSALLSES